VLTVTITGLAILKYLKDLSIQVRIQIREPLVSINLKITFCGESGSVSLLAKNTGARKAVVQPVSCGGSKILTINDSAIISNVLRY
jgi:hypothetical protein